MYFLKQRVILINLFVMTYTWMTASFCYYLIQFQMNTIGDKVTINALAFGASTLVAIATSNVIYLKIGLRSSFFFLFLSSACGGFLILVWGFNSEADWVMAMLVVMASFGVVASFNLIYACHSATFPTLFSGTAMGICNFAARIATIFAPLVA